MQVFVRDNNVEQALRVLKKKMQREGVFREMKRRRFYEKPSEQAAREKSEAVRRCRKAARKKAIFDGSIPVSFPKISSVQIRAMRQNQRIIRLDVCDPPSVCNVCR